MCTCIINILSHFSSIQENVSFDVVRVLVFLKIVKASKCALAVVYHVGNSGDATGESINGIICHFPAVSRGFLFSIKNMTEK